MIFDNLRNLNTYAALIPDAPLIARCLQEIADGRRTEEKYELDGRRLYLSVQEYETFPTEGRYLEAHRKYIDLQAVISGAERIGWAETESLALHSEKFSTGGDIAFYAGEPKLWLPLAAGTFTVLFPQDAHMPCIHAGKTPGKVKKVVVKIAVDTP